MAALACVLLAGLSLSACARRPAPQGQPGEPSAGQSRAFTDESGRRVFPRNSPARRVVSLAPNTTEMLFAIGAGPELVGVDNYSDEPRGQVDGIPKLGSDYDPSLERIVALAPDLVLTSLSANRRETVEALDRLGVPVFVTDTRSIPDLYRTLANLGALTGKARAAAEQVKRLQTGFDRLRHRVPPGDEPRVLVVVWDDPLYVAGRATFTHDLIEVCGGTNVASDVVGFAKYPLERVLRAAPEVMVLPTHSVTDMGARARAYWERWRDLPAVRAHRVHAVEDAILSRPGPRLLEGAELLFGLLHPRAERAPPP